MFGRVFIDDYRLFHRFSTVCPKITLDVILGFGHSCFTLYLRFGYD